MTDFNNNQKANQNGNNGRRSFLRNSAAGLIGGLALAKATTSAAAQGRIVPTPVIDPNDAAYAAMYAEIAQTATGRQYLSASEIDELAAQMVDDVDNLAELKATLFKFYSLNAPTMEAVLQKMRTSPAANARWIILQCNPCITEDAEQSARATISQLNGQAWQETGLPSHLAILRGWVPPGERPNPTARVAAPIGCPMTQYPFLVGQNMAFFKIQFASATFEVQQPGDTSCNVNLGPFSNTIKAWFSSSPQVHAAVWTHGLGGKLQSNGNSLYLKKWIINSYGLTMPALKYVLFTRRY